MANKKKKKAKKSPQKILRAFTRRGGGNKVTKKEVKKVIKRTKASPQKVLNIAQRSGAVRLAGPAKRYVKSLRTPKTNFDPNVDLSGGSETTQDDGLGYLGPVFAHETDIENIRADAEKYVSDAYSGAQIRGAELGLEGTKYSADKEAEWRQAVANIEVKGRLDLQPIINAGLEKVANIEAQASRDVADITGRYNVEGIKTRGEFDEKIGKINLAGSMYGLITSAFG